MVSNSYLRARGSEGYFQGVLRGERNLPSEEARIAQDQRERSQRNIHRAVQGVVQKYVASDRTSVPSNMAIEAFRGVVKLGYYHTLVGFGQPLVQIAPTLGTWLGINPTQALPMSLQFAQEMTKDLKEVLRVRGTPEEGIVNRFFEVYAPFFATRSGNSDTELMTAKERRLMAKIDKALSRPGQTSAQALRKLAGLGIFGLDQWTTFWNKVFIGAPEKAVLRPIFRVEYSRRARRNGTIQSLDDMSIYQDNVDEKALAETLTFIDDLAAASDVANKGSAFVTNGTFDKEWLRVSFLSFGGHQAQMASNAQEAWVLLKTGDEQDRSRALKLLGIVGFQGMFYSILYAFLLGQMQDELEEFAIQASQDLGDFIGADVTIDKSMAKLQERKEMRKANLGYGVGAALLDGEMPNRDEVKNTLLRLLGASYMGIDDAVFPMLGAGIGSVFAVPGMAQIGAIGVDAIKNRAGKSDFWQTQNMTFSKRPTLLEASLAPFGPQVASVIGDTFTEHSMWAQVAALIVPERALRRGVSKALAETFQNRSED